MGVSALLAAALAPSTSILYHRAWTHFEAFSRSVHHQSPPFPSLPSTIALYVSSMVALPEKAAPATIASNLSAISYYHKLAGMEDPTSHFLIRKILQGVSKSCPTADLRVPITPTILLALIQASASFSPLYTSGTSQQPCSPSCSPSCSMVF